MGDIKFDGVTPFPVLRESVSDIDGIQIIDFCQLHPDRTTAFGKSFFRISTHDGFKAFLDATISPEVIIDDEELAHDMCLELLKLLIKLSEIYTPTFFETKNLFIIGYTASAVTIGIRLDSITESGVITITETRCGKSGDAIPAVAIVVIFAIEVDKNFSPSCVSISHNKVWTGRR
jgi:hypothetical protein